MADIVCDYFLELFSTLNQNEGVMKGVLGAIGPRLSQEANQDVTQPSLLKSYQTLCLICFHSSPLAQMAFLLFLFEHYWV